MIEIKQPEISRIVVRCIAANDNEELGFPVSIDILALTAQSLKIEAEIFAALTDLPINAANDNG